MLCPQEEAEKVQNFLDKVNTKYDEVKADIRNRYFGSRITSALTRKQSPAHSIQVLFHVHLPVTSQHANILSAAECNSMTPIQQNAAV